MTQLNGAKAALVATALIATWSTAEADILTFSVTPTQTIDNFRVYTQQQFVPQAPATNAGTTVLLHQAVTTNLGTLTGGSTFTTSVTTDFVAGDYADASVGLMGTFGTGGVMLGVDHPENPSNFATNYGSSVPEEDITQTQAYGAIVSGDMGLLPRLFPKDSAKDLLLQTGQTKTGQLILFNATTGDGTNIGTYTVSAAQAVPEPGTMAAIGVGVLALLRRRRR